MRVDLRIPMLFISIVIALVSRTGKAETLDLSDFKRIKLDIADHPSAFKPKIDQIFAELSPDRQPQLWLRAFLAKLSVTEDLNAIPDLETKLHAAIALAEKNQLYDELIDFKDNLLWFELREKKLDFALLTSRSEASFAEAGQHNLLAKKAMLMASFAAYVRETGDMGQSMKLLHEANALLAQAPDATDLDRLNMKNTMALILGYQGQKDKAIALYLEALALCKKLRVRSLQATIQYNVGKSLIDSDKAEKIQQGGQLLLDALKLTQEIGEDQSAGAIMSGLGIFYRKTGQFEQAFVAGKKAIDIFTRIDDKEWIADSYKKLGLAYIEAKRFTEATDALTKALEISPEAYKQDHSQMQDLLAEALAGSKRYAEAYAALRNHVIQYKELAAEKEKSSYSKMMVGLGLQVEEEKNRNLQVENDLQQLKLQETERLRIIMFIVLGLSGLVIASMFVAIRGARQVKASKLKMQRILDNIDEGILTINREFKIEPEYSKYLHEVLSSSASFSHQDAVSTLFGPSDLASDAKSMIAETLKVSIGEDDLNWEVNSHLLPHEVYYSKPQGRYISYHWHAIYDADRRVQTVLLGLRDVTSRKALEAQIQAANSRSQRWTQKVSELLQTNLRKVIDVLVQGEEVLRNLQQSQTEAVLVDSLRRTHTVKGVSRIIGLRGLATASHEFEQELVDAIQTGVKRQNLHQHLQTFAIEITDYRELIDQIFQRKQGNDATAITLNEAINQILPQIVIRLGAEKVPIGGIDVMDRVLPWPPELLNRVSEILVHALNNCADHGFILPTQRGQRVDPVQLKIEATRSGDHLRITMSDNGIGLDLDRLSRLAAEHGFVPGPGQDIWDVVFFDGLSTAQETSETSGRGVGMSGIRLICQELSGTVHIAPNPQGGTLLVVELPLSSRLSKIA